jgi:hypothetical protein
MKSGKVLTGITQWLTNDEKATARSNIGAIDKAFDPGVDTLAEIITALSNGQIPFAQNTIGAITVLQLLSQLTYNNSGSDTTLTEALFGMIGGRRDQNPFTGDILPRLVYNVIGANGFEQSCAFGRPYPLSQFEFVSDKLDILFGTSYGNAGIGVNYMLWRRVNVEREIAMSAIICQTQASTFSNTDMGGIFKINGSGQAELYESSSTWTAGSIYDIKGSTTTTAPNRADDIIAPVNSGSYRLVNFNKTITLKEGSYLIPAYSEFAGPNTKGPYTILCRYATPVLTYCDLWLNNYLNSGTTPDASKVITNCRPTPLVYKNANNNNFFEII